MFVLMPMVNDFVVTCMNHAEKKRSPPTRADSLYNLIPLITNNFIPASFGNLPNEAFKFNPFFLVTVKKAAIFVK